MAISPEILLTVANAIWAIKVIVLRQLPLTPYQLTVGASFVYSWFILFLFLHLWQDPGFRAVFIPNIPLLILLSAFEILAVYWYYLAVKNVSPAKIGVITLTYTLFLVFFSAIFLKEKFTLKTTLGMILMVVGYLLLVG